MKSKFIKKIKNKLWKNKDEKKRNLLESKYSKMMLKRYI